MPFTLMADHPTDPWKPASAVYSTSGLLPTSHPDWQPHDYYSHLNINAHDTLKAATAFSPVNVHLETGNVGRLETSWMSLGGTQPHMGPTQYTHENASTPWNVSSLKIPSYDQVPSRCTHPAISPSWQALTLSTPSCSAWAALGDSGYGTLTNSSLGSASSLDNSMMHSTHCFADANLEDSPCGTSEAPSPAATGSKLARGQTTHKPANAGQRGGLRQYAHSKVEKRYRMNINSKIEQLKDMLPLESHLEIQPLAEISSGSRHHKRGAELSKHDVLTRTIGLLLQLQDELRQLKCQNIKLKAEIEHSRSVGS